MPNWKKVITSGSDAILNSIDVNGTGSIDYLEVNDRLQGNGSGFQFFAYNEDTVKTKFANWYSSNDRQYGMGQLWFETWFAAIDNGALRDNRRIGFYLEEPSHGASDAAGGTGQHPDNSRFYVDINGAYLSGSLDVSGAVTASAFSGSFYGDGSNLTGIEGGIFTQTGSIYATTNNLQVTGSLEIEQATNGQAIDILNANSRWRQYIDASGHITLNASGSGTTNVNYTLESGHFNVNLNDNTKDFRVKASGSRQALNVTGDGKVGIGPTITNSPQQDVQISGSVRLQDYGNGDKTGTPAYTLGVVSSGDIVEYTPTAYVAGTGLDLTGTTFNIQPDLRDGITRIGKDSSNYIAIDFDDNNSIDFYISGVWVARMEADGDLHMKGDVIAFSDIFNP